MDVRQSPGEEGSVLLQKLFAASNIGSFCTAMTETKESSIPTNKLLAVIKNDPIISRKKQ